MSISSPIPEIFDLQNPRLRSWVRSKFKAWKSMAKVMVQGHIVDPTLLSTQIPFIPSQSTFQFLRNGYFKIWPCKSKVKVMGEVKVQGHMVGAYWLTSFSFHVNRPCHSYDLAIQNLTFKIQGQGQPSRSHNHDNRSNILPTHILFIPCQ